MWALRVLALSLCVSAIANHALLRIVMKPLKRAVDEFYEKLASKSTILALEAQLAAVHQISVNIGDAIKVGYVFAYLVIPGTIACACWPLMTSIVVTYVVPGVSGVVALVQALALAHATTTALMTLVRNRKARNAAVLDATRAKPALPCGATTNASEAAVHPH
jgi:hypothetical protein